MVLSRIRRQLHRLHCQPLAGSAALGLATIPGDPLCSALNAMLGGPTGRGERTVRLHGKCLAARQSLKPIGATAFPISGRDRRAPITAEHS